MIHDFNVNDFPDGVDDDVEVEGDERANDWEAPQSSYIFINLFVFISCF